MLLALGMPQQEYACFADRASEGDRPRMHYKLLELLGCQQGAPLGSEAARQLLSTLHRPWLYDRTTGLVLEVPKAHPFVAAMLYCLHKGQDWAGGEGEQYLREHMGFWLSSVSLSRRAIHVATGLKLSAQERQAFRSFSFMAI